MPDEIGVTALAPCPFCEWDLIAVVPAGRGYHFGSCGRCKADGPIARTYADAIAAWNRRAPSPASGAPSEPTRLTDRHADGIEFVLMVLDKHIRHVGGANHIERAREATRIIREQCRRAAVPAEPIQCEHDVALTEACEACHRWEGVAPDAGEARTLATLLDELTHYAYCAGAAKRKDARYYSDKAKGLRAAILAWLPERPDTGEAARLREAVEAMQTERDALALRLRGADRIAGEAEKLIQRRTLDARSPLGDALLDYRQDATEYAAVHRSGGEPTTLPDEEYLRRLSDLADQLRAERRTVSAEDLDFAIAALSRGEDAGAGTTTWDETNAGDATSEEGR